MRAFSFQTVRSQISDPNFALSYSYHPFKQLLSKSFNVITISCHTLNVLFVVLFVTIARLIWYWIVLRKSVFVMWHRSLFSQVINKVYLLIDFQRILLINLENLTKFYLIFFIQPIERFFGPISPVPRKRLLVASLPCFANLFYISH